MYVLQIMLKAADPTAFISNPYSRYNLLVQDFTSRCENINKIILPFVQFLVTPAHNIYEDHASSAKNYAT